MSGTVHILYDDREPEDISQYVREVDTVAVPAVDEAAGTLCGFPIKYVDGLPQGEITFTANWVPPAPKRETLRLVSDGGLREDVVEVEVTQDGPFSCKMRPLGAPVTTIWHGPECRVHGGTSNVRANEQRGILDRETADAMIRALRIERRRTLG